ncbi:MAG: hypothetical protein ABFR32_03640 [Bacteroidota bacterium]
MVKPIYEITKIASSLLVTIEKLPSKSVTVPIDVPFISIDAPAKGTPFSSLTVPLISRCCCLVKLFSAFFLITIVLLSINSKLRLLLDKHCSNNSVISISPFFNCTFSAPLNIFLG